MTDQQITPSDAVLVAIDIAKVRNEVLIEFPDRHRRRKLSIRNTRDDHDRLVALLVETGKPVICGFEATGNYHRPIAWRLIQAGLDVRLVSSMAAARTREANEGPTGAQRCNQQAGPGSTQGSGESIAGAQNAGYAFQGKLACFCNGRNQRLLCGVGGCT